MRVGEPQGHGMWVCSKIVRSTLYHYSCAWLPTVLNLFNIDFHKPPFRSITRFVWHDSAIDAQILNLYKNKMFCLYLIPDMI